VTHAEIQRRIMAETSALNADHRTEVAELRDKHREEKATLQAEHAGERQNLNASHMALWDEYRGGTATTADPAARVIAHNEKIRASNLSVKLRTQFGFTGVLNDELVIEIKQRLDLLSIEYKNYGADPVEHKRLEKRERDFRAAIVTLGGSLEGVKRISWRYDEQLWTNAPDEDNEQRNKLAELNDADMENLLTGAKVPVKSFEITHTPRTGDTTIQIDGDPEGFGGDEYADPKYHGSNVKDHDHQDALDRRLHDEWGTDGGRHH
jgi:hypothetical protein